MGNNSRNSSKPVRILLDMDCVLADFVEGLAAIWGTNRLALEQLQPVGEYDYCKALGVLRSLSGGPDKPIAPEEFWQPISDTVGFWSGLKEFPWTRTLLQAVRAKTDDWYIVSSPSQCPRCIPEKREWLHRLLDTSWYDRLIPTPHKELMAKDGVVLIDDYERNCHKFVLEGGRAILFPAHHNALHFEKTEPLNEVLEALKCM